MHKMGREFSHFKLVPKQPAQEIKVHPTGFE